MTTIQDIVKENETVKFTNELMLYYPEGDDRAQVQYFNEFGQLRSLGCVFLTQTLKDAYRDIRSWAEQEAALLSQVRDIPMFDIDPFIPANMQTL